MQIRKSLLVCARHNRERRSYLSFKMNLEIENMSLISRFPGDTNRPQCGQLAPKFPSHEPTILGRPELTDLSVQKGPLGETGKWQS